MLAVHEDGSTRVYEDTHGEIRGYAENLRAQLIQFLNEPQITAGIIGLVYFIGAGDLNPIKIGFATSVDYRLRQLRTSNPQPPKVVATVPGSRRVEQKVHAMFGEFRLNEREWFTSGDALLAFIRLPPRATHSSSESQWMRRSLHRCASFD